MLSSIDLVHKYISTRRRPVSFRLFLIWHVSPEMRRILNYMFNAIAKRNKGLCININNYLFVRCVL